MSADATSGQWIAQVERQVQRIRSQITAMTAYAQKAGGSTKEIERLCAPFYSSLEQIYRDDYALASAIENSGMFAGAIHPLPRPDFREGTRGNL